MEKKYFRSMYSPTTYELALASKMNKVAFSKRYRNILKSVNIGDIFISYLIGAMRFVGLCEISSEFKISKNSLYYKDDPYIMQAETKNIIFLPVDQGISIYMDEVWNYLSGTKGKPKAGGGWMYGSIARLKEEDGQLLKNLISMQNTNKTIYPLTEKEKQSYNWYIKRDMKSSYELEDEEVCTDKKPEQKKEYFESSKIQAQIAKIGAGFGFSIWIPANDRKNIKDISKLPDNIFLEDLPLDTHPIVKYIDVLWVEEKKIRRAFEVEGTTSVYSGLLRMADLIADYPNIPISLHIVASETRKEKVFKEISRSCMAKLNLPKHCSYLSYNKINKLANDENLQFYKEIVIDKYAEFIESIE